MNVASEKKQPLPRGYTWAEFQALPRSRKVLGEFYACGDCTLIFPAEAFRPDPRRQETGLVNVCLSCERERRRRWHKENAERVNAARRQGPFPRTCSDCGRGFEAARRTQVRCPECQRTMRKTRKR